MFVEQAENASICLLSTMQKKTIFQQMWIEGQTAWKIHLFFYNNENIAILVDHMAVILLLLSFFQIQRVKNYQSILDCVPFQSAQKLFLVNVFELSSVDTRLQRGKF